MTSPLVVSWLQSKSVTCHIFFRLTDFRSSEVVFAHAVSVGEIVYCVEEQSAILVTLSDELNIVIPSPTTSTASYLDININQIEDIMREQKALHFQSSSSPSKLFEVLTIWLSKSSTDTSHFNAGGFLADSINLVFTSAVAASAVQQSIVDVRSQIACNLGISRSGPVDISQQLSEDSDEPSETQLATQLSAEPSLDFINEASKANEIHQKSHIASVAPLSFLEYDEYPLEYINGSQPKPCVAFPHGTHAPQPVTLIDAAMSPVEPHQFDESSLKLMTVEYNFEDTSDDELPSPVKKFGGPLLSEGGQAIWDRQRTLVNSYGEFSTDGCQAKVHPIEQDERHNNLSHTRKKVTYSSRKKHINQANSRPYETADRREASRILPSPDVNARKLDRQGLSKLSQRMRRDVGEPPVGLLNIPEPTDGDATKKDKRKGEDLRPALEKDLLFSDRKSRDVDLSKVQSEGQIGGNSKIVSTHNQDLWKGEFDFPISAKKALKVPTAHAPIQIATMSAQTSFRSARQPKTRYMPPPKPMLECSSIRPESRKHEGGRFKAITSTTPSIPSKRIRSNEEDGALGQTTSTDGVVVDQAKESELPQRQIKKQLNRKSQPRTKPIKAKDDLAWSTHKAQNLNINKSRKSVPVPVPLAQSRSKRVAALAANRKIQGLAESDTSEDGEDVESIHEKEISTALLGQRKRTPTSHASVPIQGRETNAGSRPSLVTPKDCDQQIMNNHEETTTTSALPCVASTTNENEKVRSLDSVDVLTGELVQPANGAINGTNKRQKLPMNASDTLPLDGRSGHQLQIELPNVKLNILEVQYSASATNHSTLAAQDLVHDNTIPLPTFTYETVTPEVHTSDHVDVLDDTGGGFFEEATAFSHEDITSLAKNLTFEGTPKAPMLDSNLGNIHDPSACEKEKFDTDTSRVADTSADSIKSTPKFSIGAKLQGVLSSIKNLHAPTKTEEKLRGVSKGGSCKRAEVTTPFFDKTVSDKMAARGTKKPILSKQAIDPDIMRLDQGLMIKENGVPSLKKSLQLQELPPGTTVDLTLPLITRSSHRTPTKSEQARAPITTASALKATNVAENDESDKVNSINEVSLQGVRKSSKSLTLNQDSRKTSGGTFRGSAAEQISSAIRVNPLQHGLQGISEQELGSAKSANKAPRSSSRKLLCKEAAGRAEEAMKVPVDSNRKPNIICFDSNGPRNQGMVSSRRVRPIQEPEDQISEISGTVKDKKLKRTIQDFGEDNFCSAQRDVVVKRPRTSIEVPRTREKISERVQKRNISIINESTQKPSSQSARVDENGSPLPFVHSRTFGLQTNGPQTSFETAAQSSSTRQGVEDGNDLLISRDGLDPSLPLLQDLSPPPASSFHFVPSSCSKHRPSSPNAPSGIIEEYTAHKVDSSGKFVNIRTDNVVMAVRPPDPFVGIQRNHQNNFIELLRRSSNVPGQGRSTNAATVNEDPDKTLVADKSVQGRNKSDEASSISSSSDSSQSDEPSPPEDPSSSEGEDNEEDEWAAALQPHQGETLDALCEISHVSQPRFSVEMFAVN